MKNIVLTGYMATGKSTIAKELAKITGLEMADTDELVEKSEGMPIAEIFEKFGEEYFRDRESEACRIAGNMQGAVIATGGGAVLRKGNIDALRKNGIIFNLEPNETLIIARLSPKDNSRPLVLGSSLAQILQRFNDRKPFYDNCDFKIYVSDEKTPYEHAQMILEKMKESEESL